MALSAPPELERLQRGLREVFTDPRGVRAAAAARPQALAWIEGGGACDPATRLSVYGDGYFLRMLEALAFDFAAVRRAAGEADFRALAAGYVTAHPSTSPSLADLGESFPAFVAAQPLLARLPFLAELAALERLVAESLLTGRRPPISREKLAGIADDAWSRTRLVFDPTVRLLQARWPVAVLWRRRERPLSASGRSVRRSKAQSLLVHRDQDWVRVREISAPQWEALRRLQGGAPLGQALDGLRARPSEVRAWFSAWLAGGLIVDAQPK